MRINQWAIFAICIISVMYPMQRESFIIIIVLWDTYISKNNQHFT